MKYFETLLQSYMSREKLSVSFCYNFSIDREVSKSISGQKNLSICFNFTVEPFLVQIFFRFD